jgi:hypothetical protein
MFLFKNLTFLSFIFVPFILLGQRPSYVFFNVKNSIKINTTTSTNKQYRLKCFVRKNEVLSEVSQRDTLFCKVRNKKKTLISTTEFRQILTINGKIVDNQLVGMLKNDCLGFYGTPATSKEERKIISLPSSKKDFLLDFQNNATQNFIFIKDSITFSQNITLQFPTCLSEKLSEKNQGLVTVYYRAAREHLNKHQPSASSGGKVMDWGHAFIGIKDLNNGKTYFLDGWPDEKFEEGKQHFEWNKNVDSMRTADHHAITFNTNRTRLNTAIKMIENYKTACINYELLDYNCADATTEILEKMGYYSLKEHSGTVLPDSFANNLMDKLDKLGVCYEYDGKKVR